MGVTGGMIIRPEATSDHGAIRQVNDAAFGGTIESDLVDNLRIEGVVLLSLVAEYREGLVGHALFSRMWIEASAGVLPAVALAPVAVSPPYQRQGIGGRLITYGLGAMRDAGERIVIVLGHPDYYPRFGFSTERARRLASPFPADAYMALDLVPGALDGVGGRVKYAHAFGL